jgi:hypothetical protein
MSGAWALATFQTNGCGGYVWGTLSNLKMNSTHHTLAGWKYPRT